MAVAKLTDAVVASATCPPDKIEIYLWDQKLAGFGCRIGRQRKTFLMKARDSKGKEVNKTIGAFNDALNPITTVEAREIAVGLLKTLKPRKKLVVEELSVRRLPVLLDKLAEDLREKEKDCSSEEAAEQLRQDVYLATDVARIIRMALLCG